MSKKKTTFSFTDEEINFIIIALEGSISNLQNEVKEHKATQDRCWINKDKENFRNYILNEVAALNSIEELETLRNKILAIIEKGGER